MYNHAPENYACPFCRLIRGIEDETVESVQTDIVYHDDRVTAFIGSRQWPNNPGNTIVVPNAHFENVHDFDPGFAQDIQRLVQMLAIGMKMVFGCDGVSTRNHNEPAGNQDVWHYHVHVTPRREGDNFYGTLHDGKLMDPAERAGYAAPLRELLRKAPLSIFDGYWAERAGIVLSRTRLWERTRFEAADAIVQSIPGRGTLVRKVEPGEPAIPAENVIEAGWEHEHCAIDWAKIGTVSKPEGYKDQFGVWICTDCHQRYVTPGNLDFIPES